MNATLKAILLFIGAYIVTMGVALLLVTLAILFVVDSHSCSAMSRSLLTLWATLAVIFLASIIVVGVVAWRFIPGGARRVTIVAAYTGAMLLSYVVIAFGMMVLFNC